MLKTAMLVSALALSAPAFAQEQKAAGREPMTTAPATPEPEQDTAATQPAPTTAAQDAPAADQAAPAEQVAAATPQTTPAAPTAPAADTATAATDTTAAPAPGATPAEPAAVTGATQIAQVVNTEFPTYDKNADTNLDKSEFGAWMVALKTASDPATKASDPATVNWIDGAFASADADKSKMVSKDELTKYLSQGAE